MPFGHRHSYGSSSFTEHKAVIGRLYFFFLLACGALLAALGPQTRLSTKQSIAYPINDTTLPTYLIDARHPSPALIAPIGTLHWPPEALQILISPVLIQCSTIRTPLIVPGSATDGQQKINNIDRSLISDESRISIDSLKIIKHKPTPRADANKKIIISCCQQQPEKSKSRSTRWSLRSSSIFFAYIFANIEAHFSRLKVISLSSKKSLNGFSNIGLLLHDIRENMMVLDRKSVV